MIYEAEINILKQAQDSLAGVQERMNADLRDVVGAQLKSIIGDLSECMDSWNRLIGSSYTLDDIFGHHSELNQRSDEPSPY